MKKILPSFLFSILIITLLIVQVNAATLNLTVTTSQSTYNRYDDVSITGQLQNGSPVTNGLVAIQVNPKDADVMVLRTVNTGTNPSYQAAPTITSVYSCDLNGNPVGNFARGTIAAFKVTVENYDVNDRQVLISINVFDNKNVPLYVLTGELTIQGRTAASLTMGSGIPTWASSGRATVFANVYSDLPSNGGIAYSPESSATFTIDGTQGNNPPATENGNNGNYHLTFKLPQVCPVGEYSIQTSSTYNGQNSTANTSFRVNQLGDFNADGIVNFVDIVKFVDAYINYSGHKPYDHAADFDFDGDVDFTDIVSFVDIYIAYNQSH